jgi:glycerate-2-kinase
MDENYAININFDLFIKIIVMIFKNLSEILPDNLTESQKKLRKIGLKCIDRAVKSVKPEKLIKNSIQLKNKKLIIQNEVFNLEDYEKVYIIGGGKATAEMAFTIADLFQEQNYSIIEGIINIPEGLELSKEKIVSGINLNFASHPIPNEKGVNGVKKMLKIVKKANENDLILCLISGGGSALLPYPRENISLEDLQTVNSLLLESGASIQEINAVRKHLSEIKGGNLAKKVFDSSGATLITIIISDVIGDPLDSIASGPTVPDTTLYEDAVKVLKKYNLWEDLPNSVIKTLQLGVSGENLETPKQDDPCFKNVHNFLIGSIKNAVNEVENFLHKEGFQTEYFSDHISGEAKEFGKELFHIIKQYRKDRENKSKKRKSLIGSGELTVTIQGEGIGGRNQEMLLSFLNYIKDRSIDFTFLIVGANLDGIEGNSGAMGALIDNFAVNQAKNSQLNLEKYLRNNNSNSLFKKLGTELITGPTGCNVNDIVIILLED